ncbi:hypothetical protein ACK3SF_04785 [Candidatus Nanosalina sp. VS9-1]|uniref:hypothetical protein n=1 Tax=Candidatus Nanosalina sp. VS9-1 TaxID=3388566 RepID=UPI0039E0633B
MKSFKPIRSTFNPGGLGNMEEFRTKRGRITFSNGKVMMEESIGSYFTNMYRGLWEEGGVKEKLIFTFSIAVLSFSASFVASAFITAPLYLKMGAVSLILAAVLAVILYEYVNNVEREKFIDYSDIESVKFIEGIKLLTCPRFIIAYSDNGEKKRRYVTMPMHFVKTVEDDVESIKEAFEEHDIEIE